MSLDNLAHTPSDDAGALARERLIDLMNRHEHSLYRYLAMILWDEEAVRDCAQDAFVRAYEQLARGGDVNARWLYTVARNRAFDDLRRRRHLSGNMSELEGLAGQTETPTRRTRDVQEAFDQLSAEDREVLFLFIIDELSTTTIAESLDTTPSAIRMRLHRARERFRRIYGGTL